MAAVVVGEGAQAGESRECCRASTDPGSGQGPHDTDLPPHVDKDADGAAKTMHQGAQLSSLSLQKILTEQGMPEIDPLTLGAAEW